MAVKEDDSDLSVDEEEQQYIDSDELQSHGSLFLPFFVDFYGLYAQVLVLLIFRSLNQPDIVQ